MSLQVASRQINSLRAATNHSAQHGRNTDFLDLFLTSISHGGTTFMTPDGIWSLIVIGLVFLPLIFGVALLGLMIAKKYNLL
jgi:hypothetical protein